MLDKNKVIKLLLDKKSSILNWNIKEDYFLRKHYHLIVKSELEAINIVIDKVNSVFNDESAYFFMPVDKKELYLVHFDRKPQEGFRVDTINESWLANHLFLAFRNKLDIRFCNNEYIQLITKGDLCFNNNLIETKQFNPLPANNLSQVIDLVKKIIDKDEEELNSNELENIWNIQKNTSTRELFNATLNVSPIEKILFKNYEEQNNKIRIRYTSEKVNMRKSFLIMDLGEYLSKIENLSCVEKCNVYLKTIFNKVISKNLGKRENWIIKNPLKDILELYINEIEKRDDIDHFYEILNTYEILGKYASHISHTHMMEPVFFNKFIKYYDDSKYDILKEFVENSKSNIVANLLEYINLKNQNEYFGNELKINNSISIEISEKFLSKFIKNLNEIKYADIKNPLNKEKTCIFNVYLDNINGLRESEIKKILLDVILGIDKNSSIEEFNASFREKKILRDLRENVKDESNKQELRRVKGKI